MPPNPHNALRTSGRPLLRRRQMLRSKANPLTPEHFIHEFHHDVFIMNTSFTSPCSRITMNVPPCFPRMWPCISPCARDYSFFHSVTRHSFLTRLHHAEQENSYIHTAISFLWEGGNRMIHTTRMSGMKMI